jgi:cell division protein FtsX
MIQNIKSILTITAIVTVLPLCIWGSWNLKRTINYKWAYQSQVQEEISKAMTNHVNQYHK